MDSIGKLQSSYRVEVSGWDASEDFFVEKTLLDCRGGEQKEITLAAPVRQGCVLFVKLLLTFMSGSNVPIAYRAASVIGNQADGRLLVSLAPLRRRRSGSAVNAGGAPDLRDIA